MRKILTVIPARGGSKGIHKKNIKDIHGKSLLAFAIEKAQESRMISHFIVSTDASDIADVALACGAEVPFLRPSELSHDKATLVEVCRHALEFYDSRGERFDAVCSLQVTTPLLSVDSIDRAFKLFHEAHAECVVTISEIRHGHPLIAKKMQSDGRLVDYFDLPPDMPRYPRQVREPAYYANGGIFLRDRSLLDNLDKIGNGLGSGPLGVTVPVEESINIDEEFDLTLAREILNQG